MLVCRAFIVPRLCHDRDEFAAIKAERMKQRLEEIDKVIKTQHYYDWLATQKEKNGESLLTTDAVWYVLLFYPWLNSVTDHFNQCYLPRRFRRRCTSSRTTVFACISRSLFGRVVFTLQRILPAMSPHHYPRQKSSEKEDP